MKKRIYSAVIALIMLFMLVPQNAYYAEATDKIYFKNASGTYKSSEEIPADCGEMLLYPESNAALSSVNNLNINIADESGGYVKMNLGEYDLTGGVLHFELPDGFPMAGKYTVSASGLVDENGDAIAGIMQTVNVTGTGKGSAYRKILTKYSSNGTALTFNGCGLRKKIGDGIRLDVYDKNSNLVLTKTMLTLTGGNFTFVINVPSYGKYRVDVTDITSEKTESAVFFVTETPCVLSADIKGQNVGNIGYDSSAVKFDFTAFAVDAVSEELSRDFSVYCDDENITDFTKVAVKNTGESASEISVDLSNYSKPYGFFNLRADIKNKVTGEHLIKDTRFSVANGAADGELNYKFGANCHYMTDAVNGNSAKYDLFKKGGFSYVRADIVKGLCCADYELNNTQKAFFAETAEKGIIPYIDLVDQYSKDREYPPVSEAALDEWEQFVYRIVEQTKQYTKYYEVWNEYSLLGTQSATDTTGPDKGKPEDYVKLLERTYRAAKRANPQCVLYGLSLANITDTKTYTYTSVDWAEEVFRLGGGAYIDGVSIHPYTNYSSPENGNFTDYFDRLKGIMEKYGCGNKPIMASEYGWSSNIVSEKTQAAYPVRAAALTYDRLEKVLWYVMTEKTWSNMNENRFGITYPATDEEIPFEAKPAYLALVNFNTILNGGTLVKKNVTGNVYDYEFKKDNGIIHVLWTKTGTAEIMINADDVQGFDIYGNCIQSANNIYTLSESPIYVAADKDNVICDTDFENGIPEGLNGFTVSYANDEGYGKAVFTPAGSDYFWYTPIRNIRSNALVSFDYKNSSENKYNIIYFRIKDKNNKEKNIEVWNTNGKLNMYSNKIYTYPQLWKFEKDKWYSFDFYFDFDTGRINGYVNGELYDYWDVADGISEIYFMGFPRGSDGFYDNLRITEYASNNIYITGCDYKAGDKYARVRFSESIAVNSFDTAAVRLINTETMENTAIGGAYLKGRTLFIPVKGFAHDTEYILSLPENTVGITGKAIEDTAPVIMVESDEVLADVPQIGNAVINVDFENTDNLSGFNANMIVPADAAHGNALKIAASNTAEEASYSTLSAAVYNLKSMTDKVVVKFDIQQTEDISVKGGYKLQLVLRSAGEGSADTYIVVTNDNKIGFSGHTTQFSDGWHTITVLLDYADNTADGWIDSTYFGRIGIGNAGKTYYPHSFHIVARKNAGLEFLLDNLRIGEEKVPKTGFYAGALKITDANGNVVTGLDKDTQSGLYASACLLNRCGDDKRAKIILGLYRGGKLTALKTADVDVAAGETRLITAADNIRLDLPQDIGDCTVKAFCWSADGIIPLYGYESVSE